MRQVAQDKGKCTVAVKRTFGTKTADPKTDERPDFGTHGKKR